MGNLSVPTFIWLLLLSMSWEVNSRSDCKINANGCSVPLGLPAPYKKTFTPACDKHDVCYYCGELYGWDQRQCDEAFKSDMYTLCEKNGKRWFSLGDLLNKKKRCKKLGADAYYTAVRSFGHLYWEKNPPSWCQAACAKNLGDPNRPLNM